MKQFFKIVFASMLGALLSLVLLIFLAFIIIAGVVTTSTSDKEVKVKSHTVLRMTLTEPILERSDSDPFSQFDFMNFESKSSIGLNSILLGLKKAKTDPEVDGIYLDMSGVGAGLSTLEEIRNALIDYKSSGKFLYAYGEIFTQKSYYLASVADSVFLNPEGLLELSGLKSQYMFFKGTFEKLDIQPQVIKVGTFKSAVEPYISDRMSDSNKVQTATYLNSLFTHMIDNISVSRNIPADSVRAIAVNLKMRTAKDAVTYKMADALKYKDEVLDLLCVKTSKTKIDDLNITDFRKYAKSARQESITEKDKIAIVYAVGEIVSGEGSDAVMGSERISRAIRKARLDKSVKAIVFRINSPGGSVLASEVIWREAVLAKKEKPFVVSMGDYAASGGYYIACAADTIVAQPTTITGSIGVYGILFNAQNFFNNKLGITFDQVKTGNYADLGDFTRPLSTEETMIIQNEVNRIYSNFTQKVANGRKMPIENVRAIAEGRVWSGIDAKRIGLVDKLGSIQDAIKIAAKMANLEKYRITSLPVQEDQLEKFMKNISAEAKTYFMSEEYKLMMPYIKTIEKMQNSKGIQARLLAEPQIN